MHARRNLTRWHWSFLAGLCALAGGCYHTEGFVAPVPPPDGVVPRELSKIVLPPYVITDGAGYGEQITPVPATGNETVLDGIARIGGLPQVASKRDIWVARRSPQGGPDQILPVCWEEITKQGITRTNYQILPGDRI